MTHLFRKAFEEIKNARKILLITHFNPDGDAIASTCAMIEFLESAGKEYLAFCDSPVPESLAFIPHAEKIKGPEKIGSDGRTDGILDSFDLILVFDCAGLERTALPRNLKKLSLGQKVIDFDHHPGVKNYAQIELRDSESSSTAEIIYDFFRANKIVINRKMATCVLTGIITDTGAFLYPSASLKTLRIGAEMLALGASHSRIVEKFLKNRKLAALKAWGKILLSLAVNRRYGLAVACLDRDEFLANRLSEDDYEGFSGLLSNLTGVKAALFLRQTEEDVIRGSIRASSGAMDVSRLAEKLGGGGHKKAAGFSVNGRLVSSGKGWKAA